jgi:hypothetical protein
VPIGDILTALYDRAAKFRRPRAAIIRRQRWPLTEGRMKRYKIGTEALYIGVVPKKIVGDASRQARTPTIFIKGRRVRARSYAGNWVMTE